MSTTTRHPGCSASPCRDHRRRWRDRGRRRRSLRSHRRRALGSHPAEPLPAVRRRRHDAQRRTGMGWSYSRYSSRATRHPLQALTLTGATLVAAIAAVLTTGLTTSPPGDVRLPWWLIALLYAGAEHNVALIRVRREAHSVSASEIPLVLGLAYASPGALLLARLVGSLAVLGACRRQRPLKLAVNLGAFLAETGVAIAAFYLVLGGQPLQGPRAWIAGLAAAAAGGATSAALITATVGVYEHDRRVASAAAGQAVSGALVATLVGTGGCSPSSRSPTAPTCSCPCSPRWSPCWPGTARTASSRSATAASSSSTSSPARLRTATMRNGSPRSSSARAAGCSVRVRRLSRCPCPAAASRSGGPCPGRPLFGSRPCPPPRAAPASWTAGGTARGSRFATPGANTRRGGAPCRRRLTSAGPPAGLSRRRTGSAWSARTPGSTSGSSKRSRTTRRWRSTTAASWSGCATRPCTTA